MNTEEQQALAEKLTNARVNAEPIGQISNEIKPFERPDAYSIQEAGIQHRFDNGEKLIGLKMGLTSEAKRVQMNLDAPLYGVLTDVMKCENGGTYKMNGSIHPKIEPEIAFHIKTPLKGKVSREEVLTACSAVYPCMEILDSRYKQFKYFSMEDVISDNSSSSHFVLGKPVKDFLNIDLRDLKMEMKVNGKTAQSGNSEDISGDPVVSVIQLCELLDARGKGIESGMIVLAGAATPAFALEPGLEVTLEVEELGNVSLKIEE